ncbi:MAG TPA: DNA polymerase I [Phycisphaerae bacterium]|nr:DNA polymerase I [Phycisphaerae bacterium]
MGKTLYIIDGHSQIYRAYFAPFRDLTSPKGEPTRATYVFTQQLLRLITDHRPDYLAMAVDGPVEQLRRRRTYPEYKVTRKPMPDDLLPQVDRICRIVEAMGIPILRAEGFEADDVIATLVERLASAELRVVMVSRDKDLDQLVGDHAVLYDPMKEETLDAAAILAEKGYPPEKAVEVQTLAGDSTDNIPGIPGVGPKTAAKLIAKYGTADEVLAHADQQTPKLRANLLEHADRIPLARELVTLERNVAIDIDLEAMAISGVRAQAIRPVFLELGFNRLLDQLDSLDAGQIEAPPADAPPPPTVAAVAETTATDFDYTCANTPEALDAVAREIAGAKRLAVDTETTSTHPMFAELVGISLAWEPGKAVYIPVRGPLGAATLYAKLVRDRIGPVLADPDVEKVGQNLKYDLVVLRQAGFEAAGPMFDTMIAAHVLDSTRQTYRLDALAAELLSHRCIPIEELIGRGKNQVTIDTVPVETVTRYAAEDADVALRLADVLAERLAAEGLTDLFAGLEMPLMPVLAEMERLGIRVDPAALKRLEIALSKEADALREQIIRVAGRPFNPDSPKQLGEVLFGDFKLPVLKKKKTGPSTDVSVLEELAIWHDLPALVLDYRKLTKLLNTYLTALAECIHPRTARVHTSFHQTGTVTGRLSSSDPNLQNIPIRTEQGRLVRSAFVADEGFVLLSADYSQVELRVLAHFCEDPTLMQAFQDDRDIHRIVAAEVFGVSPDEVTPEQRGRAKTVNFGIIYGQTAYGLSRTLRIPRNEAAEFIASYRKRFPRIDEFLHDCIRQAKQHGHVETIFGRRRKITGLDAGNASQRSAAERLAINSVVQGSAADLIKQAMLNIARRIAAEDRPSRMLLQIHDELLFEVPPEAADREREMIVAEMSGAIRLRVPLKVDVGVGKNWMEAKP